MKSPFPGMDPYIEATRGLWEEFHGHLIEEIYRCIAVALPRGYTAGTGTRCYVVLVEPQGKKNHLAKADVAVHQPVEAAKSRKKNGGAAVAEADPFAGSVGMQAFVAEKYKEKFVEVYLEGEERTLVTIIEVLSPSNKRSGTQGWDEYQRKRQAVLLGQANFIEIDLLRGGTKMPMVSPWPDAPYSLLVSRMANDGYCRVWPAHFRDRLPPIPVPLTDPDSDLTLDLQPLIDGIYSLGRFEDRVKYDQRLTPTLPRDDVAWLKKLLKGRT